MWPKYIVFDGMDGSGKGTQMALLRRLGPSIVFTREPGGTPFAEEIRKLVRDNPLAGQSTALNNFLLFWAAREELMQNLVMPALRAGKHVFSDRGDSSTFAFQLCGEASEGEDLFDLFPRLRKLVFGGRERREPDLYVVFDLPAEVARQRVMQAGRGELNHFDFRDLEYYKRVSLGFHLFSRLHPVKFIDATRAPEVIHEDVMQVLKTELGTQKHVPAILPY